MPKNFNTDYLVGNDLSEYFKTYVPQVISPFQAKALLMQLGMFDEVEAYMARPDTDPIVKLAWNVAQEFQRASPSLVLLQQVLSLTDEEVDEMFRQASRIKG